MSLSECKTSTFNDLINQTNLLVIHRELFAHKVVLSASSPMFQKIFVNGSTELPPLFKLTKTPFEQVSENKLKRTYGACSLKNSVPLPPFHGARYGATASTISGVTYIIGGADIGGNACNNVLRFGTLFMTPLKVYH